jgi:hypothetical protein
MNKTRLLLGFTSIKYSDLAMYFKSYSALDPKMLGVAPIYPHRRVATVIPNHKVHSPVAIARPRLRDRAPTPLRKLQEACDEVREVGAACDARGGLPCRGEAL